MNSLRIDAALSRLHSHKPLVEVLRRMESGNYPVDCAELELPLAAMLVCAAVKRLAGRRFLVVVPSDAEADSFSQDCQAAGVPALCFPWWHTAAYRPVEPRSAMFGQRAAALAAILDDNGPRVLVASQRAVMTPVPPREVFERGLFRVSTGDAIDATSIADRLAAWGYLRVPRVSLPGEFALRGEVLDVFMPGDELAIRIVFEFDVVEELRLFEPVSQASEKEKPKTMLFRPARELVWTPELVAKLGVALAACPKSPAEGAELAMAGLLEALSEHGEARGEEMLLPLAFGTPASLFSYLDDQAVVVLLERERLGGQSEAIAREYAGLYRKALIEGPVPPPEAILVDFEKAASLHPRVLSSWALKAAEAADRLVFGSEPPRSFLDRKSVV